METGKCIFIKVYKFCRFIVQLTKYICHSFIDLSVILVEAKPFFNGGKVDISFYPFSCFYQLKEFKEIFAGYGKNERDSFDKETLAFRGL